MPFDEASQEFFLDCPAVRSGHISSSFGGTRLFWRVKRSGDILGALLFLPWLGLVSLILLAVNPFLNPGPLFFRQQRMGRFCKPFTALKFRSMRPADENSRGADDPIETHRITPLGQILRKTRLDELPQMLNVLRGEMSLIGPRPDYFEHACEFVAAIPGYRARHAIRPGISGLAQVTLGYAEGLEATQAKATADLAYLQNAGAGLEAKIFWLTIATVFLRRGA